MRYVYRIFPYACLLGVYASWLLWAASKSSYNFNADHTLAGLMAKHALEGEWPIYVWGQEYFGNVFLPFCLIFQMFWPGNIFFIRIPFIILQLTATALWLVFAYRKWGNAVTLLTAIFLAIPAFSALEFLYFHIVGLLMILFLSAMFLAELPSATIMRRIGTAMGVGVCCGLGLWTSPSFLLFICVGGIVIFLRSEEWRKVRSLFLRALHLEKRSGDLLMTCVALSLLWSFFPLTQYQYFGFGIPLARWIIRIAIIIVCLAFTVFSRDRKKMAATTIGLLLGFVAGYFPVIISTLQSTKNTDLRMSFSYVDFHFLSVFFGRIFPATLGVNGPQLWLRFSEDPFMIFCLAAVVICMVTLLIFSLWIQRSVIMKSASLQHISRQDSYVLLLLLLAFVPLFLAFFHTPHDVTQTRYVLETIPAFATLLALGLHDRLRAWGKTFTYCCCIFFTCFLIINMRFANASLFNVSTSFSKEHLQEFAAVMDEEGVEGGYADYWVGFPINYLLNERYIFQSWSGADRYPPYGEAVAQMRKFALIRSGFQVNGNTVQSVIDGMRDAGISNHRFYRIGERLENAHFVKRRSTKFWDIWILEDNATEF